MPHIGGELTDLLQAAQLPLLACWWSGLPSFPQASEAPTLTWTNLPSPFRPVWGGGAFPPPGSLLTLSQQRLPSCLPQAPCPVSCVLTPVR